MLHLLASAWHIAPRADCRLLKYCGHQRDDDLVYLDEDRCAPIWAAMRGDGPTAPSMFPRRREDETSDD
jgi:hypothetical protein